MPPRLLTEGAIGKDDMGDGDVDGNDGTGADTARMTLESG